MAFAHCGRMNAIVLPNGLEEIENMAFAHCLNLRDVNIPDTVKAIGENAFQDCDYIPDFVKNVIKQKTVTA
jgi:hypothetical protein